MRYGRRLVIDTTKTEKMIDGASVRLVLDFSHLKVKRMMFRLKFSLRCVLALPTCTIVMSRFVAEVKA